MKLAHSGQKSTLFLSIALGIGAWALAPGLAHAASNPGAVTLEDAFRSALNQTETVSIGEARINQSDAKITQARSRFLPTISLGASYLQTDKSGALAETTSPLFGGAQSYTRLTLVQSFYEGGRDLANIEVSEANKEAQRNNLSVASYSTYSTVARGYYAILSNQKEVDNLKRTIALAKDRVNELRQRARIGKSRSVEILAAEAQVSILESQLMAAEGQLVTAWDQFILYTGLPKNVELAKQGEAPEAPQGIEYYLGLMDTRPDIASLKAQVEGSQKSIRAAKAGHLPSVGLLGNLYVSRSGTQKDNNWDAGVTLTLPLYTGGFVSAQVREAAEKESETELLLSQTRRQAEVAIRTAYYNLVSALNQLRVLESALKTTEQNYQQQDKNYRFGQATNLDVLQALNTFQDSKRTLDRTRYLAFSAWAELKAATAQVPLANFKGGSDS